MLYSLTHPRKKYIFRLDTKLWFFFLSVIFIIFLTIQSVLWIKVISANSLTREYVNKSLTLREEIVDLDLNIRYLTEQKVLYNFIQTKNKLIVDSISSLFDLIPDSIFLTEALINKNILELKGYTPSKEVYNFMLQPPLKSIFTKTESWFYPMDNGWFRFVSKNSSQNESLYEKD